MLAGLVVIALLWAIGICLRDSALVPAIVSLPTVVLFSAYVIAGERVNKLISPQGYRAVGQPPQSTS
jgi:hypothetical protein